MNSSKPKFYLSALAIFDPLRFRYIEKPSIVQTENIMAHALFTHLILFKMCFFRSIVKEKTRVYATFVL